MRAMLLLLNSIFALVALVLIGLGIYIKVDNKFSVVLDKLSDISNFEGQSLGFLAFVLIGGGVITLLICLSGCLGSLWYNRCLLYMYAIILGIVMVIELTGFILAFAYKSKLESVYRNSLKTVFTNAVQKNQTQVMNAFHDLESALKCCGVNGIIDYTSAGQDAPSWCYLHQEGCSNVIIDSLRKNLPIIGGTLGSVLLLELLGFIGAILLAVALKILPDVKSSSDSREVITDVVLNRRRNYHSFA
ncbi:unnamed protein product [Rotaria socialis]|uniref:Tetraspanin n=1 Tax=Rotaria socialis TaxID=392032 RepID=A0A818DVJ0_9BILA|nr:unnamed protein product [Rotaria socialis]CAF3401004.1 unnamed protein product [Rotaria socialis]CAF3453792.1 unnamed protein product [Rotaria socialis]CAF4227374.1 unnamed protein product [Rotaria socialis]CAF4426607.1 unnamed protein product [Rotaria socialis]